MKKLLIPALLAAMALHSAAAQTLAPSNAETVMQNGPTDRPGRNPEEMAKRQTERLTKELSLTPEQAQKVQQIIAARDQDMLAMRGQARTTDNRGQLREQMQATRAKYDAQFKEVLNPDQYTKLKAMQAERMEERGEMRREARRAEPGLKKMKAKTEDGDKLKVKADN